jgi:2-polyprenyl-6-methoxyphenol hydroxylase-like FAD-dependent oxidoreductase
MNDDFTTDVLICGAGAAGLTLAIDLARRGIRFHLIERMDQPFAGSRGKGIQPRTLEVFEDLGMADRMAALGGLYRRSAFTAPMAAMSTARWSTHARPRQPNHTARRCCCRSS